MQENSLPQWWEDLLKEHQQGVARVFILHQNVNDLVYYPDNRPSEQQDLYRSRPHPFRDMLQHLLAKEGEFGPIFYYSPTRALYHFYLDSHGAHMQVNVDMGKIGKSLQILPERLQDEKAVLWEKFADQVKTPIRQPQPIDNLLPLMEEYLERSKPSYLRMVLILDFLEKITTTAAVEGHSQYLAEEIIRRWALSDMMKKSQNLVLGLTRDLGDLPPMLCTSDSQIRSIAIRLPEKEDRLQFLSYWRKPKTFDKKLGPITIASMEENRELETQGQSRELEEAQDEAVQTERRELLAGNSKGFRLLNLEAMIRMAKVNGPEGLIDLKLWKKQKAKVINEESEGLLQEIDDKRGFEQVGGLEYAKKYLEQVAENFANVGHDKDRGCSVPKGILLVGPPGTGKTILAIALASKANMTLVKMGDIQHGIVGASEQRMSRTLELLQRLEPVVVFVDEIDQALGRRSTGYEGDSGVSRRLFAKLLEFMGSNDNRGKVLWIGASNRPDLLDPAHLSRFDAVMAILPPYSLAERIKIIEVMEKNIEAIKYTQELKDNLAPLAEKFAGLSGRDIETIIRRAADFTPHRELTPEVVEKAIGLYKPNADQEEIDRWTIYALMKVNFIDMMPSEVELYPPHIRDYIKRAIQGDKKSNQPLEECLQQMASHRRDRS